VDYAVASTASSTLLTLTANNNPGADITDATTYELHQDNYGLDADVGLVHSPLAFKQSDNAEGPCHKTATHTIEKYRMLNNGVSSETPRLFAIRTVARAETDETDQEMIFWPSISSAATVIYSYRVRAESLANDAGYPYGSSEHSETILQACLAVVEEDEGQRGVHHAQFMEMLQNSAAADARQSRAQDYGYLGPVSQRYGGIRGKTYGNVPYVWSEIEHNSSP